MINRFAFVAGVAALGLSLPACQGQKGADASSVSAAIKADEVKWNKDIKAKDLEASIGHYADDAYFAGTGSKPASGATEIRKVFADGFSDPAFDISFASDKIDAASSGDLAYARGRFTEKSTDPTTQKVVTDEGSYLTVYKKQADGSWKAIEDFDVADPRAAAPAVPGKPVTHAKMVSF